MDYYKILGVDKKASIEEIKASYKKLAKKYHPDLNRNNKKAEIKFKEINEAYDVLSDKTKRAEYDGVGSFDFGSFSSGFDFSNVNINTDKYYNTAKQMENVINSMFGNLRKDYETGDIDYGFDDAIRHTQNNMDELKRQQEEIQKNLKK